MLTVQDNMQMKPRTLMVHGNPILGQRAPKRSVKKIPPNPPEEHAIPVARPLRLLNQ
jgi:hypothetical protein